MPSRFAHGLSLHDAHGMGMIIHITCNFCQHTRYYDPADLRLLLGNRQIDSLYRGLRCEGCDKRDYMDVRARHITANERVGLTIRRLRSVRVLRRPVWEEEPL